MVIWVNPIWAWINWGWGTGLWASIRTWVIAWEELSKASQEKKVKDYFDNRQKVNNDIATWKIKSWNPWQDTIAVRKTNLVNMFAADALEKWANPDKVMAITKKPDEVLKRLTSLWEQQANAVNEYLMNGGYADRVFDYVMGKSKNPYTKVDENASNFLGWLKSVPEQTIGTALDLANKGYSKAGLTKDAEEQNKKSYEQYNQLTSSLNTDEYNAYKEWKAKWDNIFNKMFDTGLHKKYENFNEQGQSFVNGWLIDKAWMYDAYDEAVKEWFSGSVEDYARYMDNMAAQVSGGISDAVKREIENTYDTESWAFKAGKVVWDIAEFMATPELKVVKWTKYIPVLWKFLEKWWEKALEKYPKATKRLSELDKWIEWGVKFQALEDAYNNELSSAEKYLTTAAINAAVWGVLDWMVSLWWLPWKLVWTPRGSAKTSVWTKTTAEWDEMTNIVKNSLQDKNADVTPATMIAQKLKDLRQKLVDDRIISGKTLQKVRQKLQFKEWQKYTLQDLENQLNKSLMSLSKYSSQWKGKWSAESVPQISFKNEKIEISNLDKLNLFSKVEVGGNGASKTINLWDKIQNIWDSTIWVGKKPNATTMEQFLRKLKEEVHTSYKWGEDNMIKTLRKWVDTAWNKYKKTLTNKSKNSLKDATTESAWDITLTKTFDDLVWELDGEIYSAWVGEWVTRSSEATKRLFKIINDKYKIDMNNEINAWVYNMTINWGKNDALALLDTIYPSWPWLYEFAIKNTMSWLKRKWARRATKDYYQNANKSFNEGTTVPWMVRDNIRNNVKWLKNNIWWLIYWESD